MTECEIHTLDIDAPMRMSLSLAEGERVPARIVIASDSLKSGIDELEWGGEAPFLPADAFWAGLEEQLAGPEPPAGMPPVAW